MSTNLEQKLPIFLEITKALNKRGIIPILYGSLGLYRIIGQIDTIDDIDIMIPYIYLNEKFPELVKIMNEIGYKQDKTYPNEFTKGKHQKGRGSKGKGQIGFEPAESEFIKDTGANLENLKTTKLNGAEFRELTKEHYLVIYRKNLTRWEEKIDKIKRKIQALEQDSHS